MRHSSLNRLIAGTLETAPFVLTALAVTATLLGIAPAQILLALALLSAITNSALKRNFPFRFPPLKLPLFLFMGFTVLALLASPEPGIGRAPINKFWLFCIVWLTVNFFTAPRIIKTYQALFGVGVVAAVLAIVQFYFLARNTMRFRVTGFMGHWMTLSGEMMLVFICLVVYLVFAQPKRRWFWFLVLVLLALALAVTLTRSVWIATVTALILILLIRFYDWRTLAAMGVALVLAVSLAPGVFQNRMQSVFDTSDPSNYARLAIWKAGLRMVEAHPWLGVGPQRVYRVFYDYHPIPMDRFRDGFYPVHLHNNLLQFAAERGIPCALAWLWLIVKLGLDHWQGFRRCGDDFQKKAILATGLMTIIALFVAGLFEFNFGDSEVLMIFLFLVSAPYALEDGDSNQTGTSRVSTSR
jgi:putative inorganic carbon (hco3(-)) transporter